MRWKPLGRICSKGRNRYRDSPLRGHPDGVQTVGSIDSGEREPWIREPSFTGPQPDLLRPLSISYDAGVAQIVTLYLASDYEDRCLARNSRAQDARRVAVVPCTSVIRAMLVFTVSHHPAHNLLVKCMCCRFAQVIEVTVTQNYFPYYSRSVPARSGCVRCLLSFDRQRHHSLEGPINLVARRSIPHHQRRRLDQTLVEPATA